MSVSMSILHHGCRLILKVDHSNIFLLKYFEQQFKCKCTVNQRERPTKTHLFGRICLSDSSQPVELWLALSVMLACFTSLET